MHPLLRPAVPSRRRFLAGAGGALVLSALLPARTVRAEAQCPAEGAGALAPKPGTRVAAFLEIHPDGTIKLLDFGLARSLTASRLSTSLSGTPHYVAPERIRGEPASPSSDVYGVGILLYELVCGQVPWDGPVQKILAGHLDEVPRAPSTLVENVDSALETLILRALAKRPAERHKDMAAFIYELRTVMEMNGMSRRARGPAKRVVIEQRGDNPRDEFARIAFDASRIPMAMVSADGVIETANPAFATFVMGLAVEVEGLPVRSTALVNAWATAESDIERTLNGTPIRRIIEVDVAGGQVRRLLLWVDPVSRDQVLLGVHPLDA